MVAPHRKRPFLLVKVAILLFWLAGPLCLHADTVSGTVKDPSGAVIPGARIEITGGDLTQTLVLSSDAVGKFSSPDLKPGTYSLRVTREGFEPLVKTVELRGAMQVELKLAIAQQRVEITVPGKNLAYANSDPAYRKLRDLGLGETFHFDNFTVPLDAGTLQFQKGTLTFLSPVDGIVTGAIFLGEGHLNLKPVTFLDAMELKRRVGTPEADEDFTEVVFRFTREERLKFLRGTGERTETPAEAVTAYGHWKERT